MSKKIQSILILFLILTPTTCFLTKASETSKTEPTPIKNYIRGLQIDFNPPDIIQECGSLFNLKVNVTRFRSGPLIFSLSVFLKFKDQYQKEIVHKIGFIPFVYIPPLYRKTVTIEIPCLTTQDLEEHLTMISSNSKRSLKFEDGEIGVKVEKICHWSIENIFWNSCVNNGFKIKNFLISNGEDIYYQLFLNNKGLTGKPIQAIRLLQLFQRVNSVFKRNNPMIVWEPVKICPPLVCSTDITIKKAHVNKTIEHKNFTVTVDIMNNFDKNYPLNMLVVVDLDTKPIVNTLIPTLKNTHYEVGFNKTKLEYGFNYIDINCVLPEDKQIYLRNDSFTLSIECIPYIPIGNISQFGIFFFHIRWLLIIKPNYVVSGDLQEAIQEMWYNVPIFYGKSDAASIFPSIYKEFEYNGDKPIDDVTDLIKQLSSEVKIWIYLYFILISIIIFFALIAYRLIIMR